MEKDYQEQPIEETKEEHTNTNSSWVKETISQLKNIGVDGQTSVCMIHTLNCVKENSGIIMGDQANMGNINLRNRDKIDNSQQIQDTSIEHCFIEEAESLIEWMTGHYSTYDMAFIIAAAVFEKTPCPWIYDSAEQLFALINEKQEPYIIEKVGMANSHRIRNIGGKTYKGTVYNHTGEIQCEFICFQKKDYAEKVLNCVWKEYVFLREKLVFWLNEYLSSDNYTKAVRAINAIVLFSKIDFDYFSRVVVNALLSKKDLLADYAVAQIMAQLYQDETYCGNIEKNYVYWAKGENIHQLLTALMLGVANKWSQNKMELAISRYIDKLLMGLGKKDSDEYLSNLSSFYAVGQRKAVFFKTVVKVLYDKMEIYEGYKYKWYRLNIGAVFLLLLAIDASQSNIDTMEPDKNIDMIFVKMCLINNDVGVKIRKLWRFIWKNKETHKQTRNILENYLYQYGGCSQMEVLYLKSFLYSFQETESERKDMDYFLRKIAVKNVRPVKTAERVNYKLG